MQYLGFFATKQSKGYYTDGHNREDVVRYRDEVFLPRMKDCDRRQRQYSGDDMMVVTEPLLMDGEKRVVLITHDETTCYCCEGKRLMWMENGKKKILPKTNGTSILISGFTCKCHGFMSLNGLRSFQLYEAGIKRKGWFTNADLVAQVELFKDMFQELHPDCLIVVAFDNSMTHHAKSPTGLDVTNLKLGDGKKAGVVEDMKAGFYINSDGERIEQSMQRADGIQKGAKSILTERGKFKDEHGKDLKSYCKSCKSRSRSEIEKKETWDNGERCET